MPITVNLSGGLGNQMFQYAIGKNIAMKNNSKLILDLTNLLKRDGSLNYTNREYELDCLNLGEVEKIYPIEKKSIRIKFIHKFFTKYINETEHSFNRQVFKYKSNIYLNGFWQNERYFKEIEKIIKNEFQFMNEPDNNNKYFLKKIEDTNSISIHFRRGDYISNKNAFGYHGICNNEYYKKSITYIKERINDPHFFIFSDEISWVIENFIFEDKHTFININKGEKSFEDMRLMSNCKHNIIANSSFSWWGAWLNDNVKKIVIAPKTWFVFKNSDIVPNNWVKIDS